MHYPFVIFALPRSRTTWLSRWLSTNGLSVAHDLGPHANTVQEFFDLLWNHCGTIETGAQDAWPLIRMAMPTSKFITIRRPVAEVIASLAQFGVTDQADELVRRDRVLDEIESAGAMRIEYHELSDARVCADLYEYLYGLPFDFKGWRLLSDLNIQIDVPAQLQFLADRRPQIEKLKAELRQPKQRIIRIGWETLTSWWADAEPLAVAHYAEVNAGDRHGHPFKLDLPLLLDAERRGAFRVISARVNGELKGYITWSFIPDTESAGIVIADQGAWYVDPSSPGLGRKLLDRSIAMLRDLGIQSVELHHQLNGRGAKLGSLFRRMGAIEHQHRYSLWIGGGTSGYIT
jgi:hypothetical protein